MSRALGAAASALVLGTGALAQLRDRDALVTWHGKQGCADAGPRTLVVAVRACLGLGAAKCSGWEPTIAAGNSSSSLPRPPPAPAARLARPQPLTPVPACPLPRAEGACQRMPTEGAFLGYRVSW